ncbi:hypothetical protein BIW11_12721 [Tropilaelaps mercedesae]|uniref:Uncharacterized protein n=1 Tax=Tropilaelaps mercedesae TaxID=418985 RepID=A0A1V9X566_9ACAR|nr:hypothetical protein BIW11_12721 [Tropilaelaps mercedesae]
MALASYSRAEPLTVGQMRHSRRSLGGGADVSSLSVHKVEAKVSPTNATRSPTNRKRIGQNDITPTSRTGKTRRVTAIFGELVGRSPATLVSKELTNRPLEKGQQQKNQMQQAAPSMKVNKTRRTTSVFGLVASTKDAPDEKRPRQQQAKENQDVAIYDMDATERTTISPPLSRLTSRNSFRSLPSTRMQAGEIGVKSARTGQTHSNKTTSTSGNIPSSSPISPMACQPTVKPFRSLSSLRSPTPEKSPPKRLRAPSCQRDSRLRGDWSKRRSALSSVSTDVRTAYNVNSTSPPTHSRDNVAHCRLGRSQSLRKETSSTNKSPLESEDQYREWYALLDRIRSMNLSKPCDADPLDIEN